MEDKLLIQELLKSCQNLRAAIAENIEACADCLRRTHKKDSGAVVYLAQAYQQIQQLEKEIDKLGGSSLDFERLFRFCYSEVADNEKNRKKTE